MIAVSCNTSLSIIACLCFNCVAQERELELSPVVRRTVEAKSFPSNRASTTPSPLTPRTRVSASVARRSAWAAVRAEMTSLCVTVMSCSSACNQSSADMLSIPHYQQPNVQRLTTSCEKTRSATMLMSNSVMTPFFTRNHSNQRTPCARSVRVSPHDCCQVYKSTVYQVSESNTVTEATGFRSIPTSIHKYPCSVSCHVPRCPMSSQHTSHRMRPNELPQNTFYNNVVLSLHSTNAIINYTFVCLICPPLHLFHSPKKQMFSCGLFHSCLVLFCAVPHSVSPKVINLM